MKASSYVLILIWGDAMTYFEIREVLWSIVWLERRGKYSKLRRFKKTLPLMDRLTMRPLAQYVEKNRKPYEFWLKVKSVFVVVQAVLLGVSAASFWFHEDVFECVRIAVLVQVFIWFLALRLQFDSEKCTKYDRKRRGTRS